jgi:hypothetical protein
LASSPYDPGFVYRRVGIARKMSKRHHAACEGDVVGGGC